MTEGNGTPKERTKYALVLTHVLNPAGVMGYPVHATDTTVIHEMIDKCLAQNIAFPIFDEKGTLLINVILGAGMCYQVQLWDEFAANLEQIKRQQAEAQAAARLGIAPGGGVRGPRRI